MGKGIRIVRFEAENVKRLKAVAIEPGGSVIQVTGENGSGKSSLLDAIGYALLGSASHPTEPLRQGETRGIVKLALGNGVDVEFVVIRRFSAGGGTSLVIESPDGKTQFKSPQKMLDAMLGRISFDPLEFMRLTPKARADALRAIVHIDVDLDALEAEYKATYESRTIVNREHAAASSRAATFFGQIEEAMPVELIDTASLLDQMAEAAAHNQARIREEERRVTLVEDAETLRASAQKKRDRAQALLAEAGNEEATAAEMDAEVAAFPPLPDEVDAVALRDQIAQAESENARRRAQLQVRQSYEERRQEAADLAAQASALSLRLTEIGGKKFEALSGATMPIAGLSFGDGEITYENVPFAQASTAQQIRVATAIGIALNPEIRIITIKDGSLLDKKSMKILEDMAERHDVQVWIERVSSSGNVGIEMVDGSVASIDGAPVGDTNPEQERVS